MPEQISVEDLIRREAAAAGVPVELALAVAEQESSFNPTAIGPPIDKQGTRAIGTFQLLPSTAARLRVDPKDPLQNIQGGTRYLRQLLDRHEGDLTKVLGEYGGVKTNTTYVPGVLARLPKFRGAPPEQSAGTTPGAAGAETPDFKMEVKASDEPGGLGGFVKEATQGINPRNINAAVQAAFWHPIETVKGVVAAQDVPRQEAMQAFQQGDYLTGSRKMVDWLIPLIGPRLDEAADLMQRGEIARGLGATVDVGLNIAGPAIVSKVVKAVPPLRLGTRNPVVREAVESGLREGVPVDVATATENPALRGLQHLSERSLFGSWVGRRARAAQAEALTATGERLAGRTSPAPVTAEQAGQAVREAVTKRAAAYDTVADVAYGDLRALEAQQRASIQQTGGHQAPATHGKPFTNVPMAVDIAPTKAAMRGIYETLKREAELVPLMGDKARALTALDRLMHAPDLAPLSIADSALGELKNLARVDQTFRRTAGQGIAAEAVKNLDDAVRASAQQAGPDAFRALMEGRAATVNKFKTIEILDQLAPGSTEARAVFNRATWKNDAGVGRLRQIARVAPDQLRQVGRAWIEEALGKATAEGGFARAQGLFADWQNLGPQTKQLLFGNPAHVKDLDNFFLLAKRMGENPNPSGSALTAAQGTELGALLTAPGLGAMYTLTAPVIAKLLLSPTTTRLLLQGLRLPISARAARAAWAGQLGRLLEAQTAPALIPAVADQEKARAAPAPAP